MKCFNEGLEFFPRPEKHLLCVFPPHAAGFMAWIFRQAVILDGIVENRRQLVVDGLEIGLRKRLAIFVAVAGKLVLPAADIGGLDGVQRHPAEEGCDLEINQESLIRNGGGLEPLRHVLHIDFDEILKGHAQAAIHLIDEIPFPL